MIKSYSLRIKKYNFLKTGPVTESEKLPFYGLEVELMVELWSNQIKPRSERSLIDNRIG